MALILLARARAWTIDGGAWGRPSRPLGSAASARTCRFPWAPCSSSRSEAVSPVRAFVRSANTEQTPCACRCSRDCEFGRKQNRENPLPFWGFLSSARAFIYSLFLLSFSELEFRNFFKNRTFDVSLLQIFFLRFCFSSFERERVCARGQGGWGRGMSPADPTVSTEPSVGLHLASQEITTLLKWRGGPLTGTLGFCTF